MRICDLSFFQKCGSFDCMSEENIEKILDAGVSEVTADGVTTKLVTPSELRKRLRELNQADKTTRTKRPVVSTINLGGA